MGGVCKGVNKKPKTAVKFSEPKSVVKF